eukprot:7121327-Pyramimonas_sp.AAC.1
MGRTLRRAAEQVRDLCAPQREWPSITIKAFDMSNKAIYEFPTATKCSDFFTAFKAPGPVAFPSPLADGL